MLEPATSGMTDGFAPDPRLERLLELFGGAMEHEPGDREGFVAGLHGDDRLLADELLAMLRSIHPDQELLVERELAASPSRGELAPGTDVGSYRVLGLLGRGGMGDVYRAERADGVFEHEVAVKVLRAGLYDDEAIRRFERERSILARLRHPAVVPLLDGGLTADGRPYLVLQLVEGESITSWSSRHRLSVEERLRLFVKVVRVVEYAHARLVIHRDLKPSNILVTEEGEPRLLDFGIAKLLGAELHDQPELTVQGAAPLTPERAAPEQLRGDPPATATDVWGLGVLLYELLVGRLPFARGAVGSGRATPLERIAQISEGDVPRPSRAVAGGEGASERAAARGSTPRKLAGTLRGELDLIVGKALQPAVERRYASAGALADDLEAFLDGRPIAARPDTLGYRLRRFAGRHRVATAASLVALVALVAVAVVASLGRREAEQARAQAVEAAEQAELERSAAAAATTFLVELFAAADPRYNPGLELTAREILERGVERLEELDDQPAVQATLLGALGDVYRSLGAGEQAESLLRRGLELRTSGAAPAPLEVVSLENRLAGVLRERSAFDEAEALYRDALAILEREGRLGTPDEVTVLNNLGIVLSRTDQLDEADAVFRRAIELMKVHAAEDPEAHQGWSSNIANLWANLAGVANGRGRFAEAEQASTEALALLSTQLPENHPNFAVLRNNIGHFAAAQGEVARAVESARQAVAINAVALPGDHPTAAAHRYNLGRFLVRLGRIEEARVELEAAATIFEQQLGERSYERSRPLGWLGLAAFASGDLAAAGTTTRQAIDLVRGSGHPFESRDLATLLRRLAVIEHQRGDLPAARLAADEALGLARTGERPEEIAVCLLTRALVDQGSAGEDRARAEEAWREAEAVAACREDAPCALDRAEDLVLRAHWSTREGDRDGAFEALARAVEHPGWTAWMLDAPALVPLRGDPRWAGLAKRLAERTAGSSAAG